jgi:hypothetical protein
MLNREDKESEKIVKMAIKLVLRKDFLIARQFMTESGISNKVIERVIYEPHNIRKLDLQNE